MSLLLLLVAVAILFCVALYWALVREWSVAKREEESYRRGWRDASARVGQAILDKRSSIIREAQIEMDARHQAGGMTVGAILREAATPDSSNVVAERPSMGMSVHLDELAELVSVALARGPGAHPSRMQ